jgi:WD40 repeat protein
LQKIWHVKLANEFFAHKASIAALKVCDDFHIMLSTSIDGMACLWDSNKLMYIRTLKPIPYFSDETITLTCISSISADIAIIYQSGKGSRLVLYTVNGDIIGIYETGPGLTISSLTMTNLEEGTGINCIAIGLQNGIIKLLDSWTLSFVCDISVGTNEPVISIEFTCEGKRLYAALASGKVLCWQAISPSSPSLSSSSALSFRPKSVPNFRMLNPFV